ncbi:MAG TPA: KpsF/GutQ family sugar-phosphate isomerase [Chthoniobacterales bacterium]
MLLPLTDEAILERAGQVLAIEIEELEKLKGRLGAEFVRGVRLLLGGIARGGKIIVIGVGKSGQIGDKIAATFASTGCVCVVLNALNALHGDVGVVEDGDVVIALSYGGETEELLKTLSVLRRFNVEILGITGVPDSTLARLSTVTLNVAVEKEACPLNLAPTSSTTAMLALGDALAMVVLEAKGMSREDFSRYHPSGSLGRALLTQVTDVMRGRERITLVAADETVRTVLRKMSAGKNGAAVIESADGQLGGIFTHGDFARLFNQSTDIADEPVGKHMTQRPVQIAKDALAVEALALLRAHQVDEIVVVEGSRVAGVIDVQDLSRHRLL